MSMPVPVQAFQKALTANYAGNYPSIVPTAIEPSGSGVLNLRDWALVYPYCVSGGGTEFSISVIGWKQASVHESLWIPLPLCQLTCSVGSVNGVAGKTVDETQTFAGQIASEWKPDTCVLLNPTLDPQVAGFYVELLGAQKIQIIFDKGDCTSVNALVAEA